MIVINKYATKHTEKIKLLDQLYEGLFDRESYAFTMLLEAMRVSWGLECKDNSEDSDICAFIVQRQEIKKMQEDAKRFELITTLNCEAIVNKKFDRGFTKKNFNGLIGERMHEYIITQPDDTLIFKALTETGIREHSSQYDEHRVVKESVYVFKLLY